MKEKFHGVYVALLTPFDAKGRVDVEKLGRLVDFLLSKHINGLYVCGNSGEGFLMSLAERKLVAEVVKDKVEGKIKVIAQVGGYNLGDTLELVRHAERIGLDAIASVPPLYYHYTLSEIYNYYARLADATSLPFFIYYVPATTGISLSNEQLSRLGRIKNIVGLKYTDSDLFALQDLLEKMEGKWIAFSGSDQHFLPALTMGTIGSIGTTQNVIPEVFVQIYNCFYQRENEEAMKLQGRITRAVSLLLSFGWPQSWKAVLSLRGIDAGYCKFPFLKELPEKKKVVLFKKWRQVFPEYAISKSKNENIIKR